MKVKPLLLIGVLISLALLSICPVAAFANCTYPGNCTYLGETAFNTTGYLTWSTSIANAMCIANGHPTGAAITGYGLYLTMSGGFVSQIMNGGVSPYPYIWDTTNKTAGAKVAEINAYCNDGGLVSYGYYDLIQDAPPVCSFTASPQSGAAPLLVSFTDTSINSPSIWNWTIYDNSTHLPVIYSVVQNWQNYLNGADKNFDVKLTAENIFGNCTKFEPNYLNTINGSAIIINLDVKDSTTGALIYNSPVGIQNTSSGAWRNSTSPTGLVYFDSTGPSYEYPLSVGQVVNLAATPTGYKPGNVSFAIPYHNYKAYLNLVPTSVINATGNFTLVVTVVNNRNGLPITGAGINLDTGAIMATNSAGAATFRNVTSGSRQVTVTSPSGQGYQTATQTITGTSGETKMITVQLVREGETPVPTYVSPVPTTTTGNYTSGALNERGSSGLLEMMELIISLWPLIFLMGFMWFAKKVFGD